MMKLVADEGCPFTHRIRALAAYLGLELERVEVPIGRKHPVALAHSPTGRVPLLIHDGLVIGESVHGFCPTAAGHPSDAADDRSGIRLP